jgi:hypothetical protein
MGATGLLWLDRAEELKPNEIKLSGTIVDGASSVTVVWHIEPNRMLRWESTDDGKPIIRNGIFLDTQTARCRDSDRQ